MGNGARGMSDYVQHIEMPGIVWKVLCRKFNGGDPLTRVIYWGCVDEEDRVRIFRKKGYSLKTREGSFLDRSLIPANELLVVAIAARGVEEPHE